MNITLCPEQSQMINEIMQVRFYLNELALYLDTHPCDKKAIALHNEYSKKLRVMMDNYQMKYGPLTNEFPCNKWRWLEMPWPWEKGAYNNVEL